MVGIVARLREQAAACEALGSPMYAELLERVADDYVAGGPTATVLAPWADAPGPDAIGLRLLGSVHRLVLERRAGALAAFYPSVGGRWEPHQGSRAFLELLAERPEAVSEMDRPPQTNEVGRAAALLGGLLTLPSEWRLPVRLRELGSSAGLLQLADLMGAQAAGQRWGRADSPVQLLEAFAGALPPAGWWPSFVDTLGCDPFPLDATTAAGRLALSAYCWPDQSARWERLRAAFDLARVRPPVVVRQDAGEFVESIDLVDDALTVVWHSVMWQYLPAAERDHVTGVLERLGEKATPRRRLLHLRLEPTRPASGEVHRFLISRRCWPGGEEEIIGESAPHGLPTRIFGTPGPQLSA